MNDLVKLLAEYGLSDKESNVYLAMLELGPASVQEIAKKAGVNRATTYVMIESLKRRGLMSTFDKGKKTMFVAESPERLRRLIAQEMRAVQEKENRLNEVLPSFLALFNSASQEKPLVKFFEGEEGIKIMRDMYLQSRGELLSFFAVDESSIKISQIDEQSRFACNEKLFGRTIAAIKPGMTYPKVNFDRWPVKTIPFETYPFTGEVICFDNKVSFTIMKAQPIIFLIENKETYDLIHSMFEFMWKYAEPLLK